MRKVAKACWLIVLCFSCLIITAGIKRRQLTHTPYSLNLPAHFPAMPASQGITVEGANLGRYLFYDTILSRNHRVSCGSCHHQKAAFSDAPNRFSKAGNGAFQKRNTPALFNLAWHTSLFWDGKAASVEQQVFHPVRDHGEMDLDWTEAVKRINSSRFYRSKFSGVFGNQKIDSNLIANAIAQFERTIVSCRSKYDRVIEAADTFSADEANGFLLVNDMTRGDCLHCHTTDSDPFGSTFTFSNNGLDPAITAADYPDKGRGQITGLTSDYGKFKIPSLRNVAITPPYMHDGRFATLEDVLDFYSERVALCFNIDAKMEFAAQHGAHLSALEKKQIISFLYTLTDSSLITDKRYSNPFK